MDSNIIQPRLKRLKLKVRIFTHRFNVENSHSYQLGVVPGGVSEVLERVEVDSSDSFHDLRSKMEFTYDGLLTRRTSLYQEIHMCCAQTANPHNWSNKVRRASYRIGIVKKKPDEHDIRTSIPNLIPCEDEGNLLVIDFLKKNDIDEIVVVPIAATGPACGECCNGCEKCTAATLTEETVTFYLNGVMHVVKVKDISNIVLDRKLEQDQLGA